MSRSNDKKNSEYSVYLFHAVTSTMIQYKRSICCL